MSTKLTLKISEDVVESAEAYAKSRKTSLSELVENYLQKLTNEKKNKRVITPLVKSLTGVIVLPKDHNDKKNYTDYLSDKYK